MILTKKNISIFLLLMTILLSGCSEDTGEDFKNYSGYEYIGMHTISDYNDLSGKIINSSEIIYLDNDDFNVYLQIIELKSKAATVEFISNYKSQYKPLVNDNRFNELFFNGHNATRITSYTYRDGGIQVPIYQIIWNNDSNVFIVKSNSDLESSAMNLAIATGY